MEEYNNLRIEKNTQKFIQYISDLSPEKANKVLKFLETLKEQQDIEAKLESKRGWRYMWQRTPKPYLLALGYFIFFGGIGISGYQAISKYPETMTKNSIILGLILLLPFMLVAYLGIRYVKDKTLQEKDIEESQAKQDDKL